MTPNRSSRYDWFSEPAMPLPARKLGDANSGGCFVADVVVGWLNARGRTHGFQSVRGATVPPSNELQVGDLRHRSAFRSS